MKMSNIIINRSYAFMYFTREVIDNIAYDFNKEIIILNQQCWIEFEALLINENSEIILIHKNFLKPYQFKYLGEELFKAIENNYYDNSNKSHLNYYLISRPARARFID